MIVLRILEAKIREDDGDFNEVFVLDAVNFEHSFLQTLQYTAQHHVRNGRSCLEPCLRQLTTQFSDMSVSFSLRPVVLNVFSVLLHYKPQTLSFPPTRGHKKISTEMSITKTKQKSIFIAR